MRTCLTVVLGCLWAAPALAQPSSPVRADYDVYTVAVPIAALQAGFVLGPRDYRIDVNYHTTGLIGSLFSGHQSSTVEGSWDGDRPVPVRFTGDGVWRGTTRQILIEYQRGRPIVRNLVPPNEEERDAVPPDLQARSVDTLSAVAMLMRRVARTGRCESQAITYDGRRAVDIAAHTIGQEQLERTSRSSFAGSALRCDFEGRWIAGFPRDGDQSELRRPQQGSAWFAPVLAGGQPIPVRISFGTRWFGPATMYLTEAGAAPAH